MNIMRKMMGHPRLVNEPVTPAQAQDNTLGLTHLRKLFAEFRHPSAGATQKDLEDRLYNMLPLFCKVFGTAPSSDMTEKFGDILQFCSHVSRLMVSEIRRRASNQSTDAASCAIVKFLEIDSTEETSNGWMLLSTINLLSTGSASLIDCMTAASLPSTLVKCLYLFFDLPGVLNEDRVDPECEFTPRERRILLQKVFVQVLVRLCSHVSPAEELARKDDLTLLFSAITSWCPPHNVPWRKSAAEVLMTLSRHGLTPNVVHYIHNKGCVALCIDNMQRVQELSPLEIVEMFVTVFCFLKDSSEVSQTLLDDFRSCQGYIFLSEFLLRMELNAAEEAIQALRNLVLLVGSLTTCGYIELKPGTASSGSLFQMPGFFVPQPTGKGVSVRNLQAFQVLQTVFLKAQSSHLCNTILDVISSIYHQDNANYFILEPQCTLSQFAEKIHLKPAEIQIKFFEIIEFLVFNLNYVPCKEFISLSILIKSNQSVECSILCTRSLLKMLRYHAMYKDVFREVGLLEVMVTCLHRYAALMKEPQNGADPEPIPESQKTLGYLVMDALTQLLSSNSSNAGVFRECGGARCAHNMVPYSECRHQALSIVQQLVLSSGGDDDMGTLLGLMHTAPTMAFDLKTHILKSLLNVLRESHRTRTVFRKVGGFVYVMSVLVSMEGCLADPPKAPWDQTKRKDVITLLKTVFSTLTVAMRYEPANACFFATDVRYASLTEAVRLLGCFSTEVDLLPVHNKITASDNHVFDEFFCNLKELRMKTSVPLCLQSCCMMLRYLYDMALDAFDKPLAATSNSNIPDNNFKRISVYETSSSQEPISMNWKRASTGSVILGQAHAPEPVIVHAGAIISMLHLVPALVHDNTQLALDLQYHTCEVLKSVMRSEHNQQVMCEAGLPHELLTHCNLALADEAHPLHPPLQYIFERLAAQSLTPKDLRDFLRLASPLCCTYEEDGTSLSTSDSSYSVQSVIETYSSSNDRRVTTSDNKQTNKNGGAVPLTRVKCLVSMTTPRDVRLHGASITPAFVEFDMNAEGFGCLYLPSIAPQGPPNPSVVNAGMIGGSDNAVVGGIGTGERVFPPQAGLTFSTWFCVDKFSASVSDSHPARLLTLVRSIQGRDEHLICLKVYLNARDQALIVSTQEAHMNSGGGDFESEAMLNDTTVRFWCPELTQEGQWCHLVLVFHRAGIMKNSSVSLFVDGSHVKTQKLHYISPNLGGGGTASSAAVTSVFAYIGTPPQLRRQSRLIWRQGPCHLVEDIISSSAVQLIYQLGPNYVGSFQAPFVADSVYARASRLERGLEFDLFSAIVSIPNALNISEFFGEENDISSQIISEEKLIFGLHAHAVSLMTVAKIRKVYNKLDSKSIAKQLGMSAHENATPIRILHNSAGHLSGPARSFGAILMGYLGVRTFCPKPVAKMLSNVGGTSALLGLIAMATDVEELYAAVKALVCVVRSNKGAMREMERVKGYQILAMLLKKKSQLLNSHILHLTFSLVGTVDSGRESTVIPNRTAFEDLLCDLEVWREAPGDLQRSLYEHFFELLTESSEQKSNIRLMQEVSLVSKLMYVLRDPRMSKLTMQTIASVQTVLLQGITHPHSLLRFGQFLVSILPAFTVSEKSVSLDNAEEFGSKYNLEENLTDTGELCSSMLAHHIRLRNLSLDIIYRLLLSNPTTNGINQHVCDEIQRILGFDWLLLFMQGHLHSSTVVTTLRILLLMLSCPATLQKFRDGTQGGGWLDETETVLQNRFGVVLGFNVGLSNGKSSHREINQEMCHLPGFTSLQWLLPKHSEVAELYFLLMALLLGQQVKDLPGTVQFDLDSVWTFIFGVPASQPMSQSGRKAIKTDLCPEAAVVILAMVRSTLNQWCGEEEGSWLRDFPVTLMQFLLFLYHNQPDFVPLCMSESFLCALVSTLFPYRITSESNSELASPVDEFKILPGMDPVVVINTKSPRSPDKSTPSTLTTHVARKFVMDFLRMILVDSLSLPLPTKSAPVLDMVLESAPEHASRSQRREFQTDLLKGLMDHLLAADALLGEQAALPLATGGSYANTAANVFYFANRVVDKLWQGVYTRESKEVFEFISKLISQAKRKASGMSLDIIYKCLNRTILHQLSRPIFCITDQMNILDTLHKLTSSRSLVFGPGNYDQEFIGCLCYCLLQLTDDPENISSPPSLRTTTWHCDPDADSDSDSDVRSHSSGSVHSQEGMQLLSNAARRVWEELYVCKKPTIEEIFKVTLNNTDFPKISTPELQTVRPLLQEPASRVWVTYYENEKKCSLSHAEKIQSQLQSKLQKMSSGVFRLASRRTKKDLPIKTSPASAQDNNMWTHTHISIVKDLMCLHYKRHLQNYAYMQTYLSEEWALMESELMRERGLWGPTVGSDLDKWMLDMTEGPHRMCKKMIRNDNFYIHYPYRPSRDPNKPTKYKMAISYDSKKYYERYQANSEDAAPTPLDSLDECDQSLESEESMFSKMIEVPTNTPSLLGLSKKNVSKTTAEVDDDLDTDTSAMTDGATDSENSQGDKADSEVNQGSNQTVLRLLEEGEKISYMFRCARIQGLDTAEGLLLFGKDHFYVIDGFTLMASKEIADIDSLPADLHDPIIPKASTSGGKPLKKSFFKFSYEDIREVHKRRYLLQPIAIEVFSADGRNFLLAFPRKLRIKIYQRFLAVATAITDNAHQSVSGQKQSAKVEPGTGLISTLIGEKSVTQRWERGEISNFEYLMCLNTLAGRSYNDLMQYPVFPWICADYDSEDLDLNDPATFRDLGKPMGAQTPDRLQQFRKRYRDWDDPQGETPPYHYGTHYSSAMIVASYLVRMEPFTQHFLRLQGGHFDLADRMFHSVRECWLSASKHNMADVKELIPEFFYLPEFLVNSNNYDLGAKQSGVALGDVMLPAWAKGDTREFIRAHRELLECDYVSAHLNEWIDLIFGYKQQGPAAVDSVNVFHHLFYEGNVDIYSIDDPLKKNATIGFINNFGQIPKQLFKKPHPQKKLNIRSVDQMPMGALVNSSADKLFFHNLDNLKPTMQPIKELKGAVGQIIYSDKTVLAVEQNKVLVPPNYNKYLAWGFSDLSIRVGNYDSEKASLIFENVDNGDILCAACPNAKIIITAGTSTVVNVWEVGKGKDKRCLNLKRPLCGHTEPVTCLAASSAYNIIVSGSRDRTCILWDLNRLIFIRQLRGHAAPVAAVCINDVTGEIATCAGTYLYVWTINGDEIASINTATGRNQQILCVTMSQMMEWDLRNVIMTGNSDGVVRMWSVEFVEIKDESKNKTDLKNASSSSIKQNDNPQSKSTKQNPDTADASCKPGDVTDGDAAAEPNPLEHARGRLASLTKDTSIPNFSAFGSPSMSNFSTSTVSEVYRMEDASGGEVDGDTGDLISFEDRQNSNAYTDAVSEKSLEVDVDTGVDALLEIDSTMQQSLSLETVTGGTTVGDGAPLEGATVADANSTNGALQKNGGNLKVNVNVTAVKAEHTTSPKSPPTDFEVVSDSEVKQAMKVVDDTLQRYGAHSRSRKLREGFKWQRQLVFRSKLTMHTAYERKDNRDPAAVTALAVSKDHKTVYVGDGKGRVFSWSVTDQPGRVVADHWVKDDGGDSCVACSVKFSFSERRHHCRNCGQLFCSKCSRFETEIRRLRIVKPVRVCQQCYNTLRAQQAVENMTKTANR